jgi:two-component system sensor histidine kinase HydH
MAGASEAAGDRYLELAQLAGHLLHEIKNHVGTISINLQLMAEDLSPPETPRERQALQRTLRLRQECQRLADLSNDFLRFAQLRELKRTQTSLQDLLGELTDFYGPSARQANIDIKCFLPADLPTIEVDRELIKQGLLNLLLNAVQAMPQGGTITIQATAEPQAVAISVIDTGPGIPPEHLARIFEPFFTTRSGGSGLGLPLLRRIVETHGGSVQVESELGHGTKFTVRLPVPMA